jgi:hypothetical protein
LALSPASFLALALDPSRLFQAAGLTPDAWQRDLLRSAAPRILLNCSRQCGKSTVVAALALHTALFTPAALILLLSRAQRQAIELFRKVLDFYHALDRPLPATATSALKLELANGSRIVALPGKEATIRSYSGVALLAIDEAARVPEDLYRTVRPMLAVSGGRLVLLSTPFGRRGFFWNEWQEATTPWLKIHVRADQCPRIGPEFLAEERRTLGENWYRQEYEASFQALEGLVYPDFARCRADTLSPSLSGRRVGGIDFGWANPFAAVWGVLDAKDILWIQHERYERQCPLHAHAQALPRDVRWYADPAGRTEIEELRCAGFVLSAGTNALRAGIAAVTARIQTDRLKVHWSACPNLVAEASLYRYPRPDERAGQDDNPLDADNHALAALRYLISQLDRKFLIQFRKSPAGTPGTEADLDSPLPAEARPQPDHWLDPRNDALWTSLD